MSSYFDSPSPVTRRDWLTRASIAVGGSLLPSCFASPAWANSTLRPTTGKSVIFLFQQGGPPQHETFDPKVDVPDSVRTTTDTVATSVPGLHFGEAMAELAPWAHRLAVVRNFQTGTDHGFIRPFVTPTLQKASIGAYYNRVAGTNHPKTGLPRSVALFPKAVDDSVIPPRDKYGRWDHTGDLGLGYAPFIPGGAGPLQQDMRLQLSANRLDDRRRLLGSLDTLRLNVEVDAQYQALDGLRQQAVDVLLGGVADAFDWQQEDARTVARYDTSAAFRPDLWKDKYNRRLYDAHTKTMGKLLMLARRLCERGCGVVSVNTEFVWDMHGNAHNLELKRGLDVVARPFAHAVATFIEDCEARFGRQNSARRLWRNGTHAADQRRRRPRSLAEMQLDVALWRRADRRPNHRRHIARRRRADRQSGHA